MHLATDFKMMILNTLIYYSRYYAYNTRNLEYKYIAYTYKHYNINYILYVQLHVYKILSICIYIHCLIDIISLVNFYINILLKKFHVHSGLAATLCVQTKPNLRGEVAKYGG